MSYTEEEQIIVNLALSIVGRKMPARGTALVHSDAVKDYCKLALSHYDYEVFGILLLDNQHRMIKYEELFRGTIDGAAVYPREVVKLVLLHNASAAIFTHNHPSGVAEPSQADIAITNRLKQALATIDVRVLDHIIVGETITSFAERGLL